MPKGIPLTEEEQQRRRREIIKVATRLFFENGFNETSMREIAGAAGMGKSTLYDYFESKDDILVAYFEDEIQVITQAAQALARENLPADKKLRRIMEEHLDYLLANKNFYMKLSLESQRLNLEGQKRLAVARHAFQDMIRDLIEEGIREGCFRPIDSMLAMRVILGAVTPVVFTTRPSGTPHEMLSRALDMIFNGICL